MQKTYNLKGADIQREWLLLDAADKVLGRLASAIAYRLRGKHKVVYTPHLDTGDFIIVVNAEKIRVTGNKESNKIYYQHSGYPGGLKETNVATLREKSPEKIITNAVRGMLPKGPLGRQMLKKLKVYAGDSHPHTAQTPQHLTDI